MSITVEKSECLALLFFFFFLSILIRNFDGFSHVIFRDSTASPKKSPGSQVHAHFFPQQYSVERIEPGDIIIDTSGSTQISGDGSSDSPRRMYVREQFTHENTVRGNVTDSGDGVIRR